MRALALLGMGFLAITAWAVFTLPTGTAAADPASDLLAQVQASYAKAPHLAARFEQTVELVTFGTKKTTTGKLYVAKPGRFRFDYDPPRKSAKSKSFIYDGNTLWVVDPANQQVVKNTVANSQLPVAIALWTGTADLTKQFTVTLPERNVLELVPRQPSAAFAKLRLVIDGATVKQSIVIDNNGNTNMFTFSSVDANTKIDGKFFEFDPRRVPTYRVVDVDPGLSRPPTPKKDSRPVGDFPTRDFPPP